jgi:hypothetical protein
MSPTNFYAYGTYTVNLFKHSKKFLKLYEERHDIFSSRMHQGFYRVLLWFQSYVKVL